MNDIPREFSLLPRDPRTPLSDEELRQWTNARTERFVRSDRYPAALDRWLAEMAIVLGDDEAKAKLISRKEVGAILGNTRETIRVAINEGHYFRAIVLVSNVNLIAQYLGTLQQSITNDNVLLTNEGANYFGGLNVASSIALRCVIAIVGEIESKLCIVIYGLSGLEFQLRVDNAQPKEYEDPMFQLRVWGDWADILNKNTSQSISRERNGSNYRE